MIKNYLLTCLLFSCAFISYGQTTIGIQDFETTPATPTMTYTGGNVATGTGPFPSGENNFVSGSQGRKVTDGTETIEFSNVNTSLYTNVEFSVKLASFGGSSGNGADSSDYVIVDVSDDGGGTWTQQAEVNGWSTANALWHFGQGSTETNTYNPSGYLTSVAGGDGASGINEIIITDLPSVANLKIKIRFENNSGNETWIIDDAKIEGILASTDTTLNFTSATYSETENGTSVNLCVDIINESASSATTAQVVLTSGTAPHLSYTTQNITFPANSSAQQCVTVNIADNTNCADSTNYTFQIQNVAGGDSATAGSQSDTTLEITDDDGFVGAFKTLSFEGSDNFTYTGGGTVTSTTNKYFGTSSYRLENSDNLTTENIDISAITNVTLSVAFASFGADSNEDLFLDISYDNGSTWTGTGSEKLVDGYSNAGLNMGDTNASNPTTVASNPWLVNIADTETQIKVRLRAVGLDGSEYYYVDDIILSGDSCSSVVSDTIVAFTSTTSTITEDGVFVDVCASIANESATNATTVDITLDGASTATNGTDYDDGAGTPAAISFPYTLTFPAASTADQCITIFISNDDSVIESDETVVLNLINPSGGNAAILGTNTTHTVTITDNDFYDDCSTSLTIPVNSSCINQSFTNVSATDSGIANPLCGAYSGGDVWFNLVVPPSGAVTVETSENGGITDSGMALYTGTCGALTLVTCDDDSGTGNMSMISASGLTPGSTLYVRVWEYNNNDFSTFNLCAYSANEIDVERNTFASIANGNAANTGNNTVFGATEVGSTATAKNYYIRNEGSADLSITSIVSSNPTEFVISTNPAPIVIAAGGIVGFDIEFSPSALGTRTGTITIVNDDSDENPYTFGVSGTGTCAAGSITISPESGPVDTVVTVIGTNLLTATAAFNGLAATVTNISATEMEVVVPAGSTSGSLEITDSLGCPASTPFTVIDSQITSCEGNSGVVPTDLFISEITDATYGGLSYVEIFNGTGTAINIDNYSIEVIANGDATAAAINIFDLENYIMPNGTTYVIAVGRQSPVTSTNACTGVTGGSGELASSANAQFSSGGINKKTNKHDVIRLVNTGTTVDEFGVYQDNDWMDSTIITGDRGFNFRRLNTATQLPDPTFTLGELSNWTVIDWVGEGAASCSGNDYSDIGLFDFSTGVPPTVTLQPIAPAFACAFSASLTISGTEGYTGPTPADTQDLAYQWFYNVPGTSTWAEILPADTNYSGQQTATLNIIDTASLDGYQYYCQLREDTATCFEASNAVKLDVRVSIWDGTNWSALPALDRVAIINGNYDTSVGGDEISFRACSLTVNTGFSLEIRNNTFIEIENDIVANGDIIVETDGAVVQIDDLATVTGSGVITVQKFTTVLTDAYNYTYWSSPVANETIENVFSTVQPTRRFTFNAANFIDLLDEINNTGTFTPGQDDIDDNGDDWQIASGTMLPGIGYAATPSLLGPAFPVAQQFPFVGPFNNGVFTPTIVNNSAGTYNDWNFIGNPYPSAIDANVFFTVNTGITDNIYLWSQATPLNANASGNEGQNFSGADYAIINASGVNVAGGDGVIPNDFVPSGQGFFIEALSGTNITFNNSMRVTGNNDQFFRNENTGNSRNVLWLNLNSDNGVAKQIAVAHLDGATDSYDGSFYDVKENLSSGNAATIYSRILDGEDDEFVIQGKNMSSLDAYEVIHVGFKTIITVPTLYRISIAQFEGDFYTANNIYLKDNLLNTFHSLKDSDYTFTSEAGIFSDRFEIVFRTSTLSIKDNQIDANGITITELTNGNVEFKLNSNQNTITNVEIIDMLGRRVYNLRGNSASEVYNLSQLSKSAYIAKITLSNGQVISKKAIKQQ
ncbi:putative secreted protein (Por secretion system target) [Winogradskyella eximia]|uniref:Putative secreted protein (Por secretion system target) n=1 Tax=Winogradskyella eximia TaxID=262006 RepID=A0A3D9HBG9_9FLAO|nr:choice-of-anchor D domain-containing protein [Winogradskyella eximia]RED46551.1 putative secreted protein (Por secretion system target) [Winogradskyella eximia]